MERKRIKSGNEEWGSNRLAASREGVVVLEVLRVDTDTTAGEDLPDEALVGAAVPVGISLDPGVTTSEDGGVARLQLQCIDEQVKVDDIAFLAAMY